MSAMSPSKTELVILHSPECVAELKQFLSPAGARTVLATHPLVHEKLRGMGAGHEYVNPFEKTTFLESSRKAMGLLRAAGRNPRIREATDYGGNSLWFICEAALHYDHLVEAIPYFDALKPALLRASQIVFFNDGSAAARAISCLAESLGVRVVGTAGGTKASAEGIKQRVAPFYAFKQVLSAALRKKHHAKSGGAWLFAFAPGHARTLDAVASKLRSKGVRTSFVRLQRPQDHGLDEILRKLGVEYDDFYSYSDLGIEKRVLGQGLRFEREWRKLAADGEVKKLFNYPGAGISLWPFLSPVLKNFFTRRHRYSEVVRYVEIASKIMREQRPGVVVIADEVGAFGRVIALAARENNIPCVVVQHGAMEMAAVFKPLLSTEMLVWGEFYKRGLAKIGVPSSKIVVVGAPTFDSFAGSKLPSREAARENLGLAAGRKTVLWATQQVLNQRETEQAVLEAAKKLDVQLVVRPHYSEGEGHYSELVKRHSAQDFAFVRKNASFDELIAASDALVTVFSTTAIEFAHFGKPVVVLNLSGREDKIPFPKLGGGLSATSEKELEAQLEKALFDANYAKKFGKQARRFVLGQVGQLDGGASSRAADKIMAFCGK